MLKSVNPATGHEVAAYQEDTREEVGQILESAQRATEAWGREPFSIRARPLRQAAEILLDRVEPLARLMALEMGKPVREGRAEVEKCAWVCRYYADNAARFLEPDVVETEASKSYVAYRPLGLVLAIMPWNFPLWQVLRFAAPTLMAGNGAILKHAPNVIGSALAVEEILREAGFPEPLFRVLKIGIEQTAEVIADPSIKAVTLTGSVRAGRAVASLAGAALKKTVLELGGSDPYVVLEDADLAVAAKACVDSRMINSGQSCIAAKRFVVVRQVRVEFEKRVVALMEARQMGDPLEEATQLGPLARVDLRDELHRQVEESVASGARCLTGGMIPDGLGAWYPPTVLTDVTAGMPAYDEELFGPVAAIIEADSESDAIRKANDSSFGLGAAVFTQDVARGEHIAVNELKAGSCFVNEFVRSDPRLPFGGTRDSGYGRELSKLGIHEFVNAKTVSVA